MKTKKQKKNARMQISEKIYICIKKEWGYNPKGITHTKKNKQQLAVATDRLK